MDQLEKSEQRLRKVFDTIDQAIFTVTAGPNGATIAEDGRSPYALKLLGLPTRPVLYKSHFLHLLELHSDKKSIMEEAVMSALDTDAIRMHIPDQMIVRF